LLRFDIYYWERLKLANLPNFGEEKKGRKVC